MTAQTYTPRLLWQLKAELGEGPLWLPEQQRLYFVNLVAGVLHAYDDGGATHSWTMPKPICWIVPRHDGDGFMAGLQDGVVRLWLEPELRIEYQHRPVQDRPGVRLNDGKADPHGRLWAGTLNGNDKSRPDGQLFRLDPNGALHVALDDYRICNGPAFSPDGRTMYHNDSFIDRTFAYDVHTDGSLGAARLWKTYGGDQGSPDGMTVDAEGGIWVAQWGGGRVCRYSPDGELLATVHLPVSQPASCVLGGPDYKTLFITTAWESLTEQQRASEPLAGALFAADVDVPGVPPARYGHP